METTGAPGLGRADRAENVRRIGDGAALLAVHAVYELVRPLQRDSIGTT